MDEEARLEAQITAARADGADLSSLLCDLASLKLNKGEEQEAQALFNQVAELRAQELQQQAAELAEHAVQQAEQASTQNAITSSATSYNGTAPSQPSISSAAAAAAPAEPSTPTAAAAPADGDDDASDDWESCFDTGKIEQQLESHLMAAASKQQEAGSDDEGSSSSSRKNFRGRGETHWRRPAREGCEHVVEVYGLSKQHKTTHLEEFLLQHQVGAVPANIKWVDDSHALIVCASQEAAQVLLDARQHSFKLRPYHQASDASQEVSYEELTAPRGVRPKTTSAVAKRLLSHALNRPELRDREAERQLAAARRQNQQDRRERQQQAAAVWDDP